MAHCIKPYLKCLTLDFTNTSKFEDLFGNVTTVIDHFSSVLNNNNFDRRKVKNEFEMICEYVRHFQSKNKTC